MLRFHLKVLFGSAWFSQDCMKSHINMGHYSGGKLKNINKYLYLKINVHGHIRIKKKYLEELVL